MFEKQLKTCKILYFQSLFYYIHFNTEKKVKVTTFSEKYLQGEYNLFFDYVAQSFPLLAVL